MKFEIDTDKKILSIKNVRNSLGCTLREAKDVVDRLLVDIAPLIGPEYELRKEILLLEFRLSVAKNKLADIHPENRPAWEQYYAGPCPDREEYYNNPESDDHPTITGEKEWYSVGDGGGPYDPY